MAIRKISAPSAQATTEPGQPLCRFCGQPLADPTVVATYETNLRAHEAQIIARTRDEARGEIRTEYAQKEKKQLAELAARAEETVRKQYDRRTRQMEVSNRSLQQQLDIYKRRLEQLSSANRGSFNEEDLLATLKREFPDDRIERVKAGPPGRGDILQEVRFGGGLTGASAGYIVYECKDTARWDNSFVSQARAAREHHRAGHAVVVSSAFPARQRAFALIEDVVVVDAACMIPIASVLRASMVQLARAGLSSEGRRAKGDALLRYLAGQEFGSSFGAVKDATDKVEELLAKERRQHDQTWVQREGFYRRIDAGMAEIFESIRTIIEEPAESGLAQVIELSTTTIA